MEVKFRKCKKCGNVVWSFNDTSVTCCGEEMNVIKANSVDASFEKHVPNYEIIGDKIKVSVNHVMEEEHYIMWIMMVSDNEIQYKEFKPGEKCITTFNYKDNSVLYSYCNLHSLWTNKVTNE